MLKENDSEKWEKLLELQSHHDEANGREQPKEELEGVGKFIPRYVNAFIVLHSPA